LPGLALDPVRALSQYVHRSWGQEQGLSGGAIYAISRSPDGYLWIGTDRGLVRFDGTTFDLIQQPIATQPPIGRVRGLASDAQGVLWILLEGAHLLLYRNGQFADAFASLNLPETTITAMSLDQHRNVLLSGLGNVTLRSENGRLEPIANAEAVPGTVTSIAESLDGRIWMGTRDNGLFASLQGRISRVPHEFGDNKINALVPDFNGGLWVGTDQGIYFLSPQGDLVDPLPGWTHKHQILTMFRDPLACIWAGTDHGLIRISPAGQAAFRQSAEDGEVNAVFQDSEENLWFGGQGGLERLQDGIFSTFSSAEGIPAVPMGPIFADDDGGVWFAPLSGGLYWFRGGRLQQVRQDGLDRDVVYSIDGRGTDVWVGRQRGGLTRIHHTGEKLFTETFKDRNGLAQNSVYAVHVSANGTVWAGTVSGGVSVFEGSGFKTYTTSNGLGSSTVNSIAESRDGHVWVATPNGVDEFRGDRWINWTPQNGLPSSDVRLCFADRQGLLWFAASGGLSYVSGGRVISLHHLPDLMREQVLGMAEDRLGFLWFATSDHVLRANRNALLTDSVRTGDVQNYGAPDGLSGIQAIRRERTLVSDAAGRIWISLSRGIASGEPKFTERDATPVQVRIDSVSTNGKSLSLSELSRAPAGTRSMTFYYSIDSLFAPERVRFRYRLEGAETDWSDAVGWRQAPYNNLGPRNYRFHVIASRDGSLWNSPETVYSFSIDPAYWQTWWFQTAAAAAIFLSILLIMWLRSIRLVRQLNARFQERLSERIRIAQELHDTLLQSFQGLMLRFQTVANLLPARPGEARTVLEEALERADQAIAESRSAIQNIRTSPSKSGSLAESINSMMAELAEEYRHEGHQEPSYSVVIEGTPKRLSPWVNTEVLRIAQECVRNAFHHANASRIEAELKFESSHLGIRFRDDGVGIDPEVLKRGSRLGHWGMIGMRERASQIGAKLEMWSKPGAGTELDLSVPGRIAYDRLKNKGSLRGLRKRLKERYEFRSTNPDSDR
jgi:ligand-binding sensor domain-containing protein/signal transduction histidine kinase